MRRLIIVAGVVALLFALPSFAGDICSSVSGNLVANCGFETGDLTSWTFTPAASGSDFYVGGGAYSGNYAAWFGAVGSTDDSISQTLSTAPGTVDLQFYLMHDYTDTSNDFNVYWNGAPVYQLLNVASFAYTLVDIPNLAAVGNDTLQFSGREVPAWYALDSVSVVQTGSAVPEPSTVLLVLVGGALAGALKLKRA